MAQRRTRLRTWGTGARAWARELWHRLDQTRALGVAAETAFWLFLSLIPLLAVMGMLAARFSVENWADVAPFMSALPSAGRRLVRAELRELATWNGGTVSFLSAAIFVWLASSGMHSIFDGIEVQVGVTRGWLRKRLLAITVCFLLPVVVAGLACIGPGFDGLLAKLPFLLELGGSSLLRRVVSATVSIVVLFLYVYGLYFLGIPPKKRKTMPLVPGALVAVGLQVVLSFGYGLYIKQIGDGSAYVAGLAVIGVTLISLYLFSTALFVGVVLDRMLAEDRTRRLSDAAARPRSKDTPRDGSHGRSHEDGALDPL